MLPRETHTSIMKLIRLQLCPRREGSTNETNTRSKKQITKSEFYQLVQAAKNHEVNYLALLNFAKMQTPWVQFAKCKIICEVVDGKRV